MEEKLYDVLSRLSGAEKARMLKEIKKRFRWWKFSNKEYGFCISVTGTMYLAIYSLRRNDYLRCKNNPIIRRVVGDDNTQQKSNS